MKLYNFNFTPFKNYVIEFKLLANIYYFINNLLSFYINNIDYYYLHSNFLFISLKELLFPKFILLIKTSLHISFIILYKVLLQDTNDI